jgi:AcrR family transcriptional regulator
VATIRLDSDERRQAIVDSAVPLFARKGFDGTTTRELAEAAGISEALLFRHFPSKQLLYREILQQVGCQGDPVLEQLATLPASTATLAGMVRFMVRRFVAGSDVDRADLDPRLRLVLHSCLEDGDYARELFDAVFARVVPYFAASLEAAVTAGDVVRPPAAQAAGWPTNQFWFGHHIATMIAIAALPGRDCIPYAGGPEALIEEASRFILRGIGMSDAAITAHAAGERVLKTAAD